jgi:hypothetical protein
MSQSLPLAPVIRELRSPRVYDPRKYVSTWTEQEVLDGEVVDAWVVILRTRGCYWARRSGCSMCGYINDTFTDVREEDLMAQWRSALRIYGGQPVVKIYTSGNFFDASEVSLRARRRILEEIGQRCEKLVVENLPQMTKREWVEEGVSLVPRFEIAIGLETANDSVRDLCISKDFHFEWYERACRAAHEAGATVKTYLLMKPPFLTEAAAVEDVVASAMKIRDLTDAISINPTNVQRDTLVDQLFKRREYRPPWLWSVVEALTHLRGYGRRVICKPTGGGTPRGAHNCGACDGVFLGAIQDYSLGKADRLDELSCGCRHRWEDYTAAEDLLATSVDIEALLSSTHA